MRNRGRAHPSSRRAWSPRAGFVFWLSTSSLGLLGCGGGGASASTTPEPETISGPPQPWAEMSHQDKARYMGVEVLPRMQALFEGYDSERFANVTCGTCHGPDAAERDFEMPSPSLLALHPTGSAGQRAMVDRYPEGVRFMYNHVTPTMQALLAAEPFDDATGEGFTCYSCHPHAEVDEAPIASAESATSPTMTPSVESGASTTMALDAESEASE